MISGREQALQSAIRMPVRGAAKTAWTVPPCYPELLTPSPLPVALLPPQLKREQLKREGKLLTGKAKEEAERRAAIAAQLLAKAAEKGERRARNSKPLFTEAN